MRYILLFLLFPFCAAGQNTFPQLGMWREHLPYQVALDVTASEKTIFAATPLSLFSIDTESKEINRYSTVSGLSETGISAIQFDVASKKLFVAYSNSNIDVITSGSIRNIPDLKRSAIAGNKNIFAIYPDGKYCYLATGLGVVVLDAEKYEVKEFWAIGNGGGYVRTTAFTKTSSHFYAATDEGLKRTSINTANPADFRSWETLSGRNGLALAPAKAVVSIANKVIVVQNDSLFIENGNTWDLLFTNGLPVVSLQAAADRLLLSQYNTGGAAQVTVINASGTVQQVLQQPGRIVLPYKAIYQNNSYWIADGAEGLVQVTAGSIENYKPNSPQNIVLGELAVQNGVLWGAAGAVNSSWNYQYNPSGAFKLEGSEWVAYNKYNYPQLDTVLDVTAVAIDPRDGSAWVGSFGGGLVHINVNGQPQIFKQTSPIGPAVGDPSSYRVAGLAFDAEANLWIANFGSTRQLHVLKANGTWQSFSAPFTLNENTAAQIVVDDAGLKWIQSPLGNGLLLFDHGTFELPADDRWRLLQTGAGLGNLPANEVLCLAKEKEGAIWVGTTNGIAVFQCGSEAFSPACEAILPVVKEGAFANYLFRGQEVRSIAVDGANRKWVATSSGVYLVSSQGDRLIANYTQTNSPLLSNDVRKIAINGSTGEVFMATANGLISFRGEATEASIANSNVLVFPNPVPPGYSGTIGIRGLPENSNVKITEANGKLVYQTRSLGGQAVWDGRDYKGARANTGIYLVIAVDNIKGEQVVGKIVFVK
ncbi:MAG TPA: two-component regulator propeller domain-containing protein [Flavisolibacter sp.]|nr:two-component regulator propeller domain-containing protein [Flavisolibacter sp.]